MPVTTRLVYDAAGQPVAHLTAEGTVDVHALVELTKRGGPNLRHAGHALAVALGVDPAKGPAAISERQLAVLQLMARGHSNAAIARRLSLSEDTVKSHVRRVYKLLGARDRAHAVATGFRLGLLHAATIARTRSVDETAAPDAPAGP